jgi:DNA-3-methyladenine glycosylase I
MQNRCHWCGEDPEYIAYHDNEWGRPNKDDQKLFESLILESFQSGLSWITILKKREYFRRAFDDFNAEKIANYDEKDIQRIISNKNIIRNRLKIEATIQNAKSLLSLRKKGVTLSQFVWEITNQEVLQPRFTNSRELPSTTEEAKALSKKFKKANFKFMGPVVCYAFMQANGLTNDHSLECFLHQSV